MLALGVTPSAVTLCVIDNLAALTDCNVDNVRPRELNPWNSAGIACWLGASLADALALLASMSDGAFKMTGATWNVGANVVRGISTLVGALTPKVIVAVDTCPGASVLAAGVDVPEPLPHALSKLRTPTDTTVAANGEEIEEKTDVDNRFCLKLMVSALRNGKRLRTHSVSKACQHRQPRYLSALIGVP